MYLQNGVSVGIEIEYEDVSQNDLGRSVNRDFWQFTHDASCEKDAKSLNELIFLSAPDILPTRNSVLGGELVSPVIDTSDDSFIYQIRDLLRELEALGESSRSFRAGIHIHVCYANANLAMLKSTIKTWRFLEDVFFLIGGMGYTFRGQQNDSIYCRPLTKNGPIAVPWRGRHVKSLDIDDLLSAKTVQEFYQRWGDLHNQGRERYFPVRYHAFNLSPAITKGSIEFRVFNKTMNPLFLEAAINFCKKFAEFSMMSSADDFSKLGFLVENSVYNRRSKDEIARTFLEFSNVVHMDKDSIRELMLIIEQTPDVILNENVVISHLRNVRPHWEDTERYTPVVITKEISRPRFVDLHVLRGER